MVKEMVEVEKQQPGTVYKLFSPEEQSPLEEFGKVIGPEPKKQKGKRKMRAI